MTDPSQDIRQALAELTGTGKGTRLEWTISDSTDLFHWLAAQTADRKILWSARDSSDQLAAVGRVAGLSGDGVPDSGRLFAEGRELLAAFDHPSVRFYGGFSFRPDGADQSGWRELGPALFWIPRWELSGNGETTVACNLIDGDEVEPILAQWNAFVWEYPAPGELPPIVSRDDTPTQLEWEAGVSRTVARIREGGINKVVLARQADYRFESPVTGAHILSVLRPVTSRCYHFLLQLDDELSFMGTPPECLFRRKGRDLRTEALAGTRPRSSDPREDARLSDELLNSEKDRREHGIVLRDIEQRLAPLSRAVNAGSEVDLWKLERKQHLWKLERKQHLWCPVTAELKDDVCDADVLKTLHPTPAVGGDPRELALDWIRQTEAFHRGWYASPVGWFSIDACEFAVAIRSGLVQCDTVSVFSGAGIVDGSDPHEEWAEIENKISDFVTVTKGKVR